jgi:ABC-2 family transporter protein
VTRIWAVARQTISEGIRMRIALIFIAIVVMLVVGLPFSLRNEDSVSSAVQTFLSLSLRSISFVLCLLTVFLSRSISDELSGKQILILMTKPIPRWQFVVGKWLGIITLNASLVAFAGVGIYTGGKLMSHFPPRDELDKARLVEQVLTARHVTEAKLPDFTAMAVEAFEDRLETGGYANALQLNRDEEIHRFKADLNTRWRTVAPLEARQFDFENIRCERSPDKTLQLRYMANVFRYPPDEILRALWVFGDVDKGTPLYYRERRDMISRVHSISVPTDAVAPDRTLTVRFFNRNPFPDEPQFGNIVSFPVDENVAVLFNVGTFGGNLFRVLSLLMCKLMVLAAFAVLMACIFSFPVACLISFTFLAMASASAFLGDSANFLDDEGVGGVFKMFVTAAYNVAFALIPNFAHYDGTDVFVDGRNVTLKWILNAIGSLLLLYTTGIITAACVIFQRREVSEASI